ncbi:MAG: response regulator [Oscillospiraceae bacterium]|nr:response regulator [Oscillospiraceae bacterium]
MNNNTENEYNTDIKTYFENADKHMNGIICRILLFLPISFLFIFIGNKASLFHVDYKVLAFMSVLGTVICIIPTVLLKVIKVSSEFLKYYVVMSIGLLMTVLASDDTMGIWITYSLILLLTCLYYDKKLTVCAICAGYVYMIVALYLRAPGEAESLGTDWSAMRWFFTYASSLTIEYAVISFVVISIVINSINNLTRQHNLQVHLAEERERYEIALSSVSDIIFEYDITRDVMTLYGKQGEDTKKYYDYIPKIRVGDIASSEDTEKYMKFLRGNSDKPAEVRIITGVGADKYTWFRIEGKTMFSGSVPVKIIGKMSDISSEKRRLSELMDSMQRDKLTKLYTGEAAEKHISKYLSEKSDTEVCALIIMSINNIQTINESYGYMFGDLIISEVARIMSGIVNVNDIAARLNGVEFMMFITHEEHGRIDGIIKRMYEQVNNIHIIDDKNITVRIAAGFAETLDGCTDYKGLFEKADVTLSYMLANDMEYVSSYREIKGMIGNGREEEYLPRRDTFNVKEDSDRSSADNMLMFVFSVLENSKNLKSTINILLSHIGHEFGIGKISVIETDLNFLTNNISYQWCADIRGYDVLRNYHVEKNDLQLMMQSCMKDGMFEMTPELFEKFSDDFRLRVPDPNKIASVFIGIHDKGVFKRGFVFEHEKRKFEWTDEMKNTLKEISKVLSMNMNKIDVDSASRAKSNFLSNMSHEIRTPMNAIIGMTNIAKEAVGDDEKVRECLGKITVSANYLLSLINDILDMSRIESGKMSVINEPFILSELISSIDILIRPQAEEKNINFELITHIDKDFIIGDSLRLKQVLVNIAGNALKFTPTDGTGKVIMTVEETDVGNDSVNVRFSVKDNGVGISEENQVKIFQSFEQAENNTVKKFGGTGLGLAISSNLVHMMGGILEVESEIGKGSDFFFSADFAINPDNKGGEQKKTVKENIRFDGKVVLLAEDDEINTEIAVNVLESFGLTVETAENGRTAVDKFTEKPSGYYNAVFMDIRMPIMDGLEATRLIRTSDKEYARSVPVIAMTANAFDEDEKKSIESGMDFHINKPIDVSLLKNILNQIF